MEFHLNKISLFAFLDNVFINISFNKDFSGLNLIWKKKKCFRKDYWSANDLKKAVNWQKCWNEEISFGMFCILCQPHFYFSASGKNDKVWSLRSIIYPPVCTFLQIDNYVTPSFGWPQTFCSSKMTNPVVCEDF